MRRSRLYAPGYNSTVEEDLLAAELGPTEEDWEDLDNIEDCLFDEDVEDEFEEDDWEKCHENEDF